ncbi:septum formation family protein [Cellulosimicrobium sp. NPDC057862]|uniref:septum formation family protein n=1 Tax=Cellulosimicrobium sp. NPDC057862 TaxID=3346266 RepID=UPI00367277D9
MNAARTTRRPELLVVSAVALAVTASGCGSVLDEISGPSEAQRDEPSGEVTESSDADVFSIQVGDCLVSSRLDQATEIDSVPVVPCSEPHDLEIYAETELPEGDYPGDEAVTASAEEFCAGEFEPFVGLPYEESAHVYWYFTPVKDGWNTRDDRVVQCVIDTNGTDVTGSLQGSAS